MKSKLSLVTCLFVVLSLGALSGCGDVDDEPANNANGANANANAAAANTNAVNTNAAATPASTGSRATATFTASPNPIQVCDGSGSGKTTLSWDVKGANRVQVRVGSPDGSLMADSAQMQSKADTGNWVTDGAKFFLVDASAPRPATIGTVTVKVTKDGCK
jgi:hypothetical protein